MTPDERRRYFAGRSDWREHDWQDHCGDPACDEEACCKWNEMPVGDSRVAAERKAFAESILGAEIEAL